MTDKINQDLLSATLNEAFFLSFLISSGWTGERERLSDDEIEDLKAYFSHPVKNSFNIEFWLNHIFSNFYTICREQKEARQNDTYFARASQVRDALDGLMDVYAETENMKIFERRGDIQKALSSLHSIGFKYLNFLSTQARPEGYPSPYKIRQGDASDAEFLEFLTLIEVGHTLAAQNVKRGGNGKPLMEQMCRALCELYYDATDVIPKRQSKFNNERATQEDAGPLLSLAQGMERCINGRLGDTQSSKNKNSLQSPTRKVITELIEEVKLRNS